VGNWQRNALAERNEFRGYKWDVKKSCCHTHCKVVKNLRAYSDQKSVMDEKNYTYARKLVAREN